MFSAEIPNTLRLHCSAHERICANDERTLVESILDADRQGTSLLILGSASNVVLPPTFAGRVVLVRTRGIVASRVGERVEVTAAAGENWHNLVRWTLGRGLSGLEALALIPGTVGAAPLQNIGAYGADLAKHCVAVRVLDRTDGAIQMLSGSECGFDYRTSMFKADRSRFVILDVRLSLATTAELPVPVYPDVAQELERRGLPDPTPAAFAEAVVRVRRRKLPDCRYVGNVGSFFKNPVVDAAAVKRVRARFSDVAIFDSGDGRFKLSAAQLIDQLGWKQRSDYPNCAVWQRQPLVLINRGHAEQSEVLQLADAIRDSVEAAYDVRLEIEPDIIRA